MKFLANRAQLEIFNNQYSNFVFKQMVGASYVLSLLGVLFLLEKI